MSNRWKGGFIQAYFDPLTEGPLVTPLYAWGLNGDGQLGLNDIAARSSPTQVGEGPWTSIEATGNQPDLLKTAVCMLLGQTLTGNWA